MKFFFDLFTSPFGLPIDRGKEYLILVAIGIVAFWLAYYLAGRNGIDAADRKWLHWTYRFVIFVALWALIRGIIWIVRNPMYAAIITGSVVALVIMITVLIIVFKRKKNKRGEVSEN